MSRKMGRAQAGCAPEFLDERERIYYDKKPLL
jgi:hypothetical protein